MSEEKYFEMLWDCVSCDTKGLLAKSQRHCPLCGCAQDPAKRYFPEPGKEVEIRGHSFVGADWRCAYCDSPSSAAAAFCSNCGAGKDGAKKVATVEDPLNKASPPAEPEKKPASNKSALAVIAAVVIAIAGIAGFFLSKNEVMVEVSQMQWLREIDVERYSSETDSAWCDAMPAGAYSISRSREQRSQRKVEDGQACKEIRTDKGDGTFTKKQECSPKYRNEPVYADKCRFTTNRWQAVRTLKDVGDKNKPPSWPVGQFAKPSEISLQKLRIGEERLGKQRERFNLVLSGKDKTYDCEVSASQWGNWKPGAAASLKIGTTGADCDSLKPR